MPSIPSNTASQWVLNYVCIVGSTTPLGAALAAAFGAPIPWHCFIGTTIVGIAALQCASGRRLLFDVAKIARAMGEQKRRKRAG